MNKVSELSVTAPFVRTGHRDLMREIKALRAEVHSLRIEVLRHNAGDDGERDSRRTPSSLL